MAVLVPDEAWRATYRRKAAQSRREAQERDALIAEVMAQVRRRRGGSVHKSLAVVDGAAYKTAAYRTYSVPGSIKSANLDNGVIEAIVSVTGNRDRQADVIVPGAYKKALASGRLPAIVKQHDWKVWLGKTVDARELMPGDRMLPDKLRWGGYGGVWVKGEFTMEDPVAAAVYAHLRKGVITEFSVGFDVDKRPDGSEDVELKDGVRYIKTIFPWYEWSPVLMGANPETVAISVKGMVTKSVGRISDEESLAEYEEWVRKMRRIGKMRPRGRQPAEPTRKQAPSPRPITTGGCIAF